MRIKTTRICPGVLAAVFLLSASVFVRAESAVEPVTIVVTGTRIPSSFFQGSRNVTVIEREDIENASWRSVPELLNSALGVDIQERGAFGAQADVSIRGSTFQQTLILVDGIRINDSQTAHHNMDLPLSVADIERIEILRGPGSSVYGSDAFGGVINIITKTPSAGLLSYPAGRLDAEVSAGADNARTGAVSVSRQWGSFGQSFSAEKKTSDGFQQNTDFEIYNFTGKSNLRLAASEFNLLLGVTDKDFGAENFYGTVIDEEREKTRAEFAGLSARIAASDRVSLESNLYSRRHDDLFAYEYAGNPYQNEHATEQSGMDAHLIIKLSRESTLVSGGAFSADKIDSSNMGKHKQNIKAPYFEYRTAVFEKLSLDLGLRADYHSVWGRRLSPTAGLGWRLDENWKIRSAAGGAFRSPSFTELYYITPSNKGDASLHPEKNTSYEVGADYSADRPFGGVYPERSRGAQGRLSFGVTVFRRNEKDVIDWVKDSPGDPQWLAKNTGRAVVKGAEITSGINIASLKLSVEYSFVDIKAQKGYISKYALRAPEHQFSSGIEFPTVKGCFVKMQSVYKKRPDEDGYFLLSSAISKKYEKFELFLRGTNILNVSYEEIPDAPSPPRWLGAGLRVKI